MAGKPFIEGHREEQVGCCEGWLGVWMGRNFGGAVARQDLGGWFGEWLEVKVESVGGGNTKARAIAGLIVIRP